MSVVPLFLQQDRDRRIPGSLRASYSGLSQGESRDTLSQARLSSDPKRTHACAYRCTQLRSLTPAVEL